MNKSRAKILFALLLYACAIGAGALCALTAGRISGSPNPLYFPFFAAVLAAAVSFYIFRDKASSHPEYLFAACALIAGLLFICVSPARSGICWDDETHYYRTLSLADYLYGHHFEADTVMLADHEHNTLDHVGFDRESRAELSAELEELYASRAATPFGGAGKKPWIICYVHMALGVLFGRLLHLTYAGVFGMGRFFNLLLYVFLFSLAIRILKRGKYLLAAVGLIPTSLFMAASYAYDPWVIAFSAVGYAYLFSVLSEPDKKIRTREFLFAVLAVALAAVPKAIYFFLLLPFLFLPKDRFSDRKQRRILLAAVLLVALLLVLSFILPMLVSAGGGDARGGADVNSAMQIQFILKNPFAYAGVLFQFLRRFLSLEQWQGMTLSYAYYGTGRHYVLVVVTLIVTAFLDHPHVETGKGCGRVRASFGVSLAALLILIPTAMYISFTPVGLDTINGMQERYLLPMLFPALYLAAGDRMTASVSQKVLSMVPAAILSATFFYAVLELCVLVY